MAAGTRSSKGSPRRRQLRISYVENGNEEIEGKRQSKEQRSSKTSSRRARVHPEGSRGRSGMVDRAEEEARKRRNKKPDLSINTNQDDERRQSTPKTASTRNSPREVRNSRDLRSPGASKTPMAQINQLPDGQPLPDFITQTDANGNATTPRSASAIEGARKSHPSGPRSRLNGRRDGNEEGSEKEFDDPCDSFLDSFRMMCCCFSPDNGKDAREVRSGGTQDTDDKERVRLLGPFHPDDEGKKCLVLDLDETLVHSSFRPVPNADFVIPVPIEDVVHFVYVMKRPGVDEFLLEMAKHYEIVIYTASLNKYADPLLDLLDPHRVIRARLFRESCAYYEGNYVKDLSLLDRDLSHTIIIDNSPSSYMFHPENAIDCSSFIDDPKDRELDQIGAFLAGIKDVKDVRGICHQWRDWPVIDYDVDQESR